LIHRPPKIRPSGFDLETGATPELVSGARWRALARKAATLNVWRDGTLIYAADAREPLCWGTWMTADGPLRINQLALIESTYLFALLTQELYKPAAKLDAVQFHLLMHNMTVNNVRATLIPGPVNSLAMRFGTDINHAPESTLPVRYDWRGPKMNPGEISFELVSQVYSWFGLTEDQIPYRDANGGRWIDPNEITKLHP
jgi:hypothetical protein